MQCIEIHYRMATNSRHNRFNSLTLVTSSCPHLIAFLCTAIAKDARQRRGFSPDAGARTFLSAASWEALMIIEIPRPVARAEVAADRNVRAPLGCGFAALRPLRLGPFTPLRSLRLTVPSVPSHRINPSITIALKYRQRFF
jgi:hypothetical protein